MSAWLCNDEHIYEIAHYFVANCQKWSSRPKTFQEVSEVLHAENVKSLVARYDDEEDSIVVDNGYVPVVTNIFHLAKLVDSYEYQSCEHDEFEASLAKEICDAVRSGLLSNHADYEADPLAFDHHEYLRNFNR